MIWGKRGVSDIIATVLLLLLTVTSVAIISAFIIPFVRDNLNEGSNCLNINEGLNIIEGESCYDPINPLTKVAIRRGNIDIDGIFILLDNNGNGDSITFERSDLPEEGGGEKIYTIDGQARNQVKIGAIVKGKRCGILDEEEIRSC